MGLRRLSTRLPVWRVRRIRRHLVGLLTLLTLAVFEPLFCIIHCEIWMPLSQPHRVPHAQAHQHMHQHSHGAAHVMDRAPVADPPPTQVHCGVHGPLEHPSHTSPAQPFHEMMLAAGLLLLAPSVWKTHPAAAAPAPPQRFPTPLYRPPISLAMRVG